jgi:hypothetical protein
MEHEHRMFNLIRKTAQVQMQSIEHFPFRSVRNQIPDLGIFGRIPTKLLQTGLIILHVHSPSAQ